MSAALLWLVCLVAPARAFWGDYATEPPPEIFGVRLGDDIRNYKGMAAGKLANPELFPGEKIYSRKSDKGLMFNGVPVKEADKNGAYGPSYSVYKNKIYAISFNVSKEDYAEALRQMDALFGPCREIEEGFRQGEKRYSWLNYEVSVESSSGEHFSVQWQPVQKSVPHDRREDDDKMVFAGVTLGSRIDDYLFLQEAYREGPDVVYYTSKIPPPVEMRAYVFSAYKGIIYGVKFVFDKDSSAFKGVRRSTLDWLGRGEWTTEYLYFWGEVRVDTFSSTNIAYARLMPLWWDANRARLAYYRDVKPD